MALRWDSIPLERKCANARPPSPTLAWPCEAGGVGPVPWSVYDLDNLIALSLPAQPTWMPAMLCAEVEKLA